jgi:hypothetical protein
MLLNGYQVPVSCVTDQGYLAMNNKHPRDKMIAFDQEPHVYYVCGQTGFTSVTTFIHHHFPAFNGDLIAAYMANSRNFPHADKFQDYKHLDKTATTIVQDIQNVWKEKAELGTKMHAFIEKYFNDWSAIRDMDEKYDPAMPIGAEYQYFQRYQKLVEQAGLIPFRTEWMIFDTDYGITGSIDMIFVHQETGKYHMRDWKRSKAINETAKNKGFGPCAQLDDCNLMHYSLQLNLYKFILEKNYGIAIESMALVIFHPNFSNFLVYEVQAQNFQDIVKSMLTEHALELLQSLSTLRPE